MTKYKTRREVKNGIIKWVSTPIEESEEDNQSEIEDHKDKDLEIKRLTALIELLEGRIKQLETNKPKEVPASDVMAVAAASTYSCYG